jgi:sirohydrochlorin cobaltochelatase
VNQQNFPDAALVVLGHGSSLEAEAGATVFQHAAELRQRKYFAEVREAFWKQQPRVTEILPGLTAPRVFVAPLFAAEGHFSEAVIPRALGFSEQGMAGRVQARGRQVWILCKPVGTHDGMADVVLTCAGAIVEKFPFPHVPSKRDMTLILVGHGTEQNEDSDKAVAQQVELIRARQEYAAVHGLFLDEEPRVTAWHQLVETRNVVVVPFFMNDGPHVREDIPKLLGGPERALRQRLEQGQSGWRNPTERHGKLVWYAPAVGSAREVADVIIKRVREASVWPASLQNAA